MTTHFLLGSAITVISLWPDNNKQPGCCSLFYSCAMLFKEEWWVRRTSAMITACWCWIVCTHRVICRSWWEGVGVAHEAKPQPTWSSNDPVKFGRQTQTRSRRAKLGRWNALLACVAFQTPSPQRPTQERASQGRGTQHRPEHINVKTSERPRRKKRIREKWCTHSGTQLQTL